MLNPAMIFKIKGMWDGFTRDHPKFLRFLHAVTDRPMEEGTIIELSIRRPGGDTIASNIKLTASDLELIEQLKQMGRTGM